MQFCRRRVRPSPGEGPGRWSSVRGGRSQKDFHHRGTETQRRKVENPLPLFSVSLCLCASVPPWLRTLGGGPPARPALATPRREPLRLGEGPPDRDAEARKKAVVHFSYSHRRGANVRCRRGAGVGVRTPPNRFSGATPPEKAGPRRRNGRGPATRFPEIRDPAL